MKKNVKQVKAVLLASMLVFSSITGTAFAQETET